MRVVLIALAALSLAACQRSESEASYEAAPAAEAAAPTKAKSEAPAMPLAQLAYRYSYAINAPAKALRDLVSRHEAACASAGPDQCQVISANVSSDGEDRLSGQLKLRAQPGWLKGFRAGLEADAQSVGGRLAKSDVDTDDLSRTIVDTEAELKSRIILRDRLQQHLATRPGKLTDLFEMEQELARVQGEIDAMKANVASMKTRVATSELTIAYASTGVMAPDGVFAPLGEAANDVVRLSVGTLSVLVRLLAIVAPVGVAVALGLWIGRLSRRKRVTPAS
jgi:hypothetical protein